MLVGEKKFCVDRKRLTNYGRERRALVSDTRSTRKRRKELITGTKNWCLDVMVKMKSEKVRSEKAKSESGENVA